MISYSCFIGKVPVTLELNKEGFWAKYKKSKMTPEAYRVLDEISSADDVGLVIEEKVKKVVDGGD